MIPIDFKYIFQNAFDTFKVFDIIPMEVSGILIEGHSKTIWQTLNHLIIWRTFQIGKLKNIDEKMDFNESDTWILELMPIDSNQWHSKINEFKVQTEEIRNSISKLSYSDLKLEEKLKLIQDSSSHLSFHLGEIILIARQKNKYPQPSEMNEFLKIKS